VGEAAKKCNGHRDGWKTPSKMHSGGQDDSAASQPPRVTVQGGAVAGIAPPSGLDRNRVLHARSTNGLHSGGSAQAARLALAHEIRGDLPLEVALKKIKV